MKYRFYSRKNIYGEQSVFAPNGSWVDDFEDYGRAKRLVRILNQFLREVGLYK